MLKELLTDLQTLIRVSDELEITKRRLDYLESKCKHDIANLEGALLALKERDKKRP